MEQIDIDAAKRMKNHSWFPALKEYYEPQDVVRYFREIERYPTRESYHIIKPERFFKKDILKKGLELLRQDNIRILKDDLSHLKNKKIPKIEAEIERLEKI